VFTKKVIKEIDMDADPGKLGEARTRKIKETKMSKKTVLITGA